MTDIAISAMSSSRTSIPDAHLDDHDDEKDDDDMADLFSFGNTTSTPASGEAFAATGSSSSSSAAAAAAAIIHGTVDNSTTTTHSIGEQMVNGSSNMNSTGTPKPEQLVAEEEILADIPKDLQELLRKKDNGDDDSHDSFMELLNLESDAAFDDVMTKITSSENSMHQLSSEHIQHEEEVYDTQQYDEQTITLLKWLDTSGSTVKNREVDGMTEEVIFDQLLNVDDENDDATDNNNAANASDEKIDVPKPFGSLAEALRATDSTKEQIREVVDKHYLTHKYTGLFGDGIQDQSENVDNDSINHAPTYLRPELYCRMICGGKSISDIVGSSLADSFEQWRYHRRQQQSIVGRTVSDDEEDVLSSPSSHEEKDDNNETISSRNKEENTFHLPSAGSILKLQAKELAKSIAQALDRSVQDCETDVLDLLLYYYHFDNSKHGQQALSSSSTHESTLTITTTTNENSSPASTSNVISIDFPDNNKGISGNTVDVFIPTVAAMILAANVPVSASAVVMSQIIPTFMPVLALHNSTERYDAAMLLHSEFYYLACYHLPLLVIHLDRHIPGWQWPNTKWTDTSSGGTGNNDRKIENGQIPPSWLLSLLAGECTFNSTKGDVTVSVLQPSILFQLWDRMLTYSEAGSPSKGTTATANSNIVSRFFLTLALLEQVADKLILLTGDVLVTELQSVFKIPEKYFPADLRWVEYTWWACSLALQRHTPQSVLQRIRYCEDGAVQGALRMRQIRTEANVQARLDAEAAAHKHAQEVAAQAARDRLSRARLVAFYRQYAPDKESNIDKIMSTYNGRLDVLDKKLKMKYGVGFNPALDPNKKNAPDESDSKKKISTATKANNFFATMHQSFHVGGGSRRKVLATRIKSTNAGNRMDQFGTGDDDYDGYYAIPKVKDQVSVTVSPDEVIPILCWSKEAVAARGSKLTVSGTTKYWDNLKFHIIDCRTEEAASEQGRFPTAFHVPPDLLMDPEQVRDYEDRFEALRGMCHIVIMGEGYSALPKLYNQRLTPNLEELMLNDEARTNGCALFFCKKGFPFVSVLEDGYAGALAFLYREGSKHQLYPSSVLSNYSQDTCIFGQFVKLYHSSATEKAQRKMQRLLETGLVTVTKTVDKLTFVVDDQQQQLHRQNSNRNQHQQDNAPNSESPANAGMQTLRRSLFNRQDIAEADASSSLSSNNTSFGEQPTNLNNPFKGLGAALNSTMKSAATIAASAGGVNDNTNNQSSNINLPEDSSKPAAVFGMAKGFAGLNNFRRNTMARIQVQRNTSGSLQSATAGATGTSPSSGPPQIHKV